MSGIAAIYDWSGKEPSREELDTLLQTIEHRGPTESVWFGLGVALGQRLLATTPEAIFERLPIDVCQGRFQVALDGRLDNRRELFSALGEPLGNERTDAELIALAYARWGEACVQRFIGDFAFVLWDAPRLRLLAARDQRGFRPLYYAWAEQSVVFASEPSQFFADSLVPRTIDENFLACYLTGAVSIKGSTPYSLVSEVPPAHYVVVENGHLREREYWHYGPRPKLRYHSRAQYVEHFSEIFGNVAASLVRCNGTPGVLLSGGLDSSYVAARAHEFAPNVMAISAFAPDTKQMDERKFSRAVVGMLGIESVEFDASDCWSLSSAHLPLDHFDTPSHPMQAAVVSAACRIAGESGVQVLLDGVGGDEFYTGDGDYLAQLACSGRLVRAWGEARAWSQRSAAPLSTILRYGALMPLLPPGTRDRWRALREKPLESGLPSWIDPAACRATGLLQALELPSGQPAWRSETRAKTLWSLYLSEMVPIISWWQRHAGLPNGIESRSPFWDLRLIEFVLATPAWVHREAGRPKMLLRGAMRGLVPEAVIERDDKGVFDELLNVGIIERELPRILRAVNEGPFAALPFVDIESLNQEIAKYCEKPHSWWDGLWRAITAALWLEFENAKVNQGHSRQILQV